MLLGQTIFNTLPFQRAHVNSFQSSGLFKGSVLHNLPVVPPDLGVLVIVPVYGINVTAFPFPVLAFDAVAVCMGAAAQAD